MLSLPQNCSESVRITQSRIAEAAASAGRSVDSVTLLAVSKGQSSAAIDSAASAGVEHFGENFLQESLPKIEELSGRELTWHFIGRLQANKTRPVAENFAWVHAVDRFKIAERLSAQRPFHAPSLNICLQLHVGGEASKGGVELAEIPALARQVSQLPHLRLRGIMCMPPAEEDVARQRLGQERCAHVIPATDRNLVAPDDRGGAEAEKRRHDIEAADQNHGPDDADPSRFCVRDGVKPDKNMRQAGRSENERHP
jgi:pyridoxal phosphate enzyme (YggS family)